MKSLKEFQVQIDEVLTKKTPLTQWIHDFVHSDDPKFAGKSKDERIKMAQGAYYGAQKESMEEGENKQMKGKDPCWKDYQMVGMKKKGDRTVPNCVPVKEDISIDEGKMAELHASLSQHLDKHVAEYKRAGGAESLGHKSTVAAGKISKEHGIAPHHAQKFVNDYIENKLKESMKEDIRAEHVREAVEYKGIGTDVVDKKKKLNPQPNLTTAKKTVKDFKEEVKPADQGEYDYEGQMSRTQLQTTMRNCKDLIDMIDNEENMPEWVQSKITLAKEYITSVRDYLQSKQELGEETINELKASTLKSYSNKSWQKGLDAAYDAAHNVDKEKNYQLASKRFAGSFKAKSKLDKMKEEVEQIDELSKKTLANYVNKASHDAASGAYQGKEYTSQSNQHTAAGDWDASKKKHDQANKEFNRANKRLVNIPKATTKLAKEEVEQIDELSKGLVARYANKVAKTTQANYDKSKDKFQFSSNRQDGMKNAVKRLTKEETVEESRGHKVIATFLKNREVAKRAYSGNPAKDAEVAQGGGSPADQGIAAAKKDYKKLNKEGVSMLNFNDFLKEAKCGSMKKEELKGNQHKLDHNKNGKLDADDFKKLRGENKDCDYEKESFVSHAQRKAVWASKNEKGVKEEVKDKKDSPPFDPDPKPAKKVTPGKYGQGYSQAKHLAQKGMRSLTKEDLDQFTLEEIEEFMTTESYEQLDEISKETLASYIPKAAKSSRIHGMISTDYKNAAQRKKNPGLKRALDSLSQKYKSKAWSREKSIAKAVGKLTKEDVDINEGKMKDIHMSMMDLATRKGYSSHKQFTPADYDALAKPHGISGKDLAVALGHKTAQKVAKEDVDFEQTEKVSYNQFIKSIEEGKIDDYLDKKRADANTASAYGDKKKSSTKQPSVTINKGRAYGGSNQKDDEGDEKPETTEKRGRGRPTGSKSGARQKGNGHNDGGIPVHNLNLPTRNNKF